MHYLKNRQELYLFANRARFFLRHYAEGFFPVFTDELSPHPCNRMFFPLRNPNGNENYIRSGKHCYYLQERHFYFVPAYLPAEFRLDDELFFLSIQTNLEVFPGTELFSSCSKILELSEPKELSSLLKLFETTEDALPFAAIHVQSLVFSLLVSLLNYYSPEDFRNPLSLRRYSHLIDYMQTYGNAETRVTDLASRHMKSREDFSRCFMRETGITPKHFIDNFLIAKCMELLDGPTSIKEIAYNLKFSSEFVFSRFFKAHLGISPLAWRKRYQTGYAETFSETGTRKKGH